MEIQRNTFRLQLQFMFLFTIFMCGASFGFDLGTCVGTFRSLMDQLPRTFQGKTFGKTRPVHGKLDNRPLVVEEISHRFYGPKEGPILVMIHGFGSSKETFHRTAQMIGQRGIRVLTYDRRGDGQTIARGNDYGTNQGANDLKSLLDGLGIYGKVHIVGHSLGARTGLEFENKNPDRVASLFVEDMRFGPMIEWDPHEKPGWERRATKLAGLSGNYPSPAALKTELAKHFTWWEQKQILFRGLRTHSDNSVSLARPSLLKYSLWHDAFIRESFVGMEDMTAQLRSSRAPMRILAAQYRSDLTPRTPKGLDPRDPRINGYVHFEQNRPDASIHKLPHSVHTIHYSHSKAFVDAVVEFVSAVGQ